MTVRFLDGRVPLLEANVDLYFDLEFIGTKEVRLGVKCPSSPHDAACRSWTILALNVDSGLRLWSSLPESLGLPLDDKGCVLVNQKPRAADVVMRNELALVQEFVKAVAGNCVYSFADKYEYRRDYSGNLAFLHCKVAADVLQRIEAMHKDVPAEPQT